MGIDLARRMNPISVVGGEAGFVAPRTPSPAAVGVRKFEKAELYLYFPFFFSGMSAIIYQLLWQRELTRLYGANIESATAVITAFMLGLGVGSLLGSLLSRRGSSASLLIFAGMELTIAVFALVSMPIFEWLGAIVGGQPLSIRILATIATLIVPTCCMGATLPLLVGHSVKRSGDAGFSTGSLYYINTLGAVVGGLSCAIFLFPFLGISFSIKIAAALNIIASFTAIIVNVRSGTISQKPDSKLPASEASAVSASTGGHSLAYRWALILAGLSGFVSLSYEIFFLHVASFASGTNSFVFVMILTSILLGIAGGARAVSEASQRGKETKQLNLLRSLTWSSVAGQLALPILAHGDALGRGVTYVLIPIAFVIARAIGAIFPFVVDLAVKSDFKAGYRVGLIYMMNILGCTTGALLTGFVFSQLLGLQGMSMLLAVATLGLGLTMEISRGFNVRRFTLGPVFAIVGAASLLVLQGPLSRDVFEKMLARINPEFSGPLKDVVENRVGVIAVTQQGTIYGGGLYDGAFNIDPYKDVNGVIRPYSLSFFHPDPENVLMIGLSSGSWAQVIVNNPYVKHLTVIEINPGYVDLIRRTPIVSSLLSNPKFTIIVDDGHRWLSSHPDVKYDAILANSTFHFRTDASNLLSVEFDQLIKSHLQTGGVYFYNTTDSVRAERTGCETFGYGYRVMNHVMVSDRAFQLDTERWRRVLSGYTIDGIKMFPAETTEGKEKFDRIVALPSALDDKTTPRGALKLESCDSLLRRTPPATLITDDNMGTEWRWPLLGRE